MKNFLIPATIVALFVSSCKSEKKTDPIAQETAPIVEVVAPAPVAEEEEVKEENPVAPSLEGLPVEEIV